MNPENPSSPAADPPGSSFSGPVQELIAQGILTAPPHLGVLAQLDEFEILQLIGRGGMGVVFLARDSRTTQHVAIKLMRPDLAADPELTQRFVREAKRLQGLNHPHLLPVLEIRERARGPYFVMPCFDQGSLRTLLAERKPLPRERILEIAGQLAEALRFLHKTPGLIHRDVKPENVLLDANGSARLADLGLARSVTNDSFLSLDKTRLEGTAPYMSPAVAAGEEEDTRYDIYSFGAVLYELLTGQPPYRGGDAKAIVDQVKAGPPPEILRVNPQADKALARVAEKAMARTLRARYAEMADVCADLERIRSGGSVTHRGVRKGMLVAGIVLLLALAGVWSARSLRPYQLKTVRSIPASDVSPFTEWVKAGDWDGDEKTDLVFAVENKIHAVLNDGTRTVHDQFQRFTTSPLRVRLVEDFNQDGLTDLFVSWNKLDPAGNRSEAYIKILERNQGPWGSFTFEGSFKETEQFGKEGTLLSPLKTVDLDRDGRRELLAEVSSSRALHPRGLCCFDLQTGRKRWFFETSTYVNGVEVQDVDGDGLEEVIVGSNSPNNGHVVTNALDPSDVTWDTNSFLYLLAHDGNQRWRRKTGGPYSQVKPIPRAGDSKTPGGVFAWVLALPLRKEGEGTTDPGALLRFDHQGTLLAEYRPGAQFFGTVITDLDEDGRVEVLSIDHEGLMHVLDEDLKPKSKPLRIVARTHLFVESMIIGAADLCPEPGLELVVTAVNFHQNSDTLWIGNSQTNTPLMIFHDETLLVLSSKLEVIAQRVIATRVTAGAGTRPTCFLLPPSDPEQILVVRDPIEFIKLEK